ncbi:MAG TPA: nuclear transport factor 2 family protein, partial [Novosphingobium sp.]|nr:nuclear transport factor 2 family protein [Novosphingobium sp.]
SGRDAIVKIYAGLLEKFTFVSMSCFVTDLVIGADRASGKAYSQELMFPRAGGQRILCGCFHDSYRRIDGAWHFQSRTYETLYRASVIDPPV